MFFDDCFTWDEAKKKYRELAKKMHPDIGGNNSEMAELNAEYSSFSPRNRSGASGTQDKHTGTRSWTVYDDIEDNSNIKPKLKKRQNNAKNSASSNNYPDNGLPWNMTNSEYKNWLDGKNQCDSR